MRSIRFFAATLAITLCVSSAVSSAWAQDLSDATRKIRGDYGQHTARSYSTQRSAAAPAARTFSYEPAAAQAAPAPSVPAVAQAPAPAPAQARRTYSYEPSTARMNQGSRRDTPSLLLPKGDARRVAPVIHW
jgi:hypothetical protein